MNLGSSHPNVRHGHSTSSDKMSCYSIALSRQCNEWDMDIKLSNLHKKCSQKQPKLTKNRMK